MNKLSCFVAITLISSSMSIAHAEPKMSGTIYYDRGRTQQ